MKNILSLLSQATPHVSGLIANWINTRNNVPPRDMKAILRAMATKDALSGLREFLITHSALVFLLIMISLNAAAGTDNLLANNGDGDDVSTSNVTGSTCF